MRDMPNAQYGEQQAMQEIQSGAPMAKAQPMPNASPMDTEGMGSLVPFDAPTQRPDEPGQSGASMGPGSSPEALGLPNPAQQLNQADLEAIKDKLPMLEWMANRPGAMPSTRQLVRRLKSMI